MSIPTKDQPPCSTIRLATRGSRLARAQAALAAEALRQHFPHATIETVIVSTAGDRETQWSLEQSGGTGLFSKELEESLLRGESDLAVHSAKDLPGTLPEGLSLAAFLPREAVHDVLIRRADRPQPSLIATSSPRRREQLRPLFPNAAWTEIRGNVETRLQRIAENENGPDATLLAAAGLARLGIQAWEGLTFEHFDPQKIIPAVGQAAIALQCRFEDAARFAILTHQPTDEAVSLERLFLRLMGGGCHSATAGWYHEGQLYVFHETSGRCQLDLRPFSPENREEALTRFANSLTASRTAMPSQEPPAPAPLAGRRIVLTRATDQVSELRNLLTSNGAEVIELPLIQTRSFSQPEIAANVFAGLGSYDWILFTSANGVNYFFEAFFRFYEDIRGLGLQRIGVVGKGTRKALKRYFLKADLVPNQADAEGLAEALIAETSLDNLKILIVEGSLNRDGLAQRLESERAIVDRFTVYETLPTDLRNHPGASRFRQRSAHAIVFASSSAVRSFVAQAGSLALFPNLPPPAAVSIGKQTSEALRQAGIPIAREAREPTLDALLEALINLD